MVKSGLHDLQMLTKPNNHKIRNTNDKLKSTTYVHFSINCTKKQLYTLHFKAACGSNTKSMIRSYFKTTKSRRTFA